MLQVLLEAPGTALCVLRAIHEPHPDGSIIVLPNDVAPAVAVEIAESQRRSQESADEPRPASACCAPFISHIPKAPLLLRQRRSILPSPIKITSWSTTYCPSPVAHAPGVASKCWEPFMKTIMLDFTRYRFGQRISLRPSPLKSPVPRTCQLLAVCARQQVEYAEPHPSARFRLGRCRSARASRPWHRH